MPAVLRRWRPHGLPVLCILVAVLVANGPALLHLVTTNPLYLDSNLTTGTTTWLPGLPYIDPNSGFTTQTFGHLVALDWLHGHVPWWNPFEGIGSPLAAEMQSAAFFPPVMLLAFHNGLLIMQVSLEVVAGWATYALARRLDVGRTLATAAGVAFGLCGTYAWFTHAPIRPVAFLPLCLLGVELALDAARRGRWGGWVLLALSIALSIVAGFPETSFICGIFVVAWVVLRTAGPGRSMAPRFLIKVGTGVGLGAALALPLLVAFVDYLPHADIGPHNGAGAAASVPTAGLIQVILPYALGPINGFNSAPGGVNLLGDLWSVAGGFLTTTIIAAGLVGLVGRRNRILRLGLGAWILLCLLRTFGYPPVVTLLHDIPGVRETFFFRWSDPTWELSVVVLAALGLDDIARRMVPRWVLAASALVTGAVAAWASVSAWRLLARVVPNGGHGTGHPRAYPVWSMVGCAVVLIVLVAGGLIAGQKGGGRRPARLERRRRAGRVLMGGAVAVESVLLLGFAYLSAPQITGLQLASVHWLQAHQGTYRFVTFGPIAPNYGSYFSIAEANVNDLPVPTTWNNYIETSLDPNALSLLFTGYTRANPAGPTSAQELTARMAAYEEVGIRYVVESSAGVDSQGTRFPAAGTPPWPDGPRLVHRDSFAEIWELPAAGPAFSLLGTGGPGGGSPGGGSEGCRATTRGWDQVTVHCARPTTLLRRVLYLPGWSATVDGRSVPVSEYPKRSSGLLQTVEVPAGTTVVRFTYLPPHEVPAIIVSVLAGLSILVAAGAMAVRRRREGAGPAVPAAGEP